MREPKVIPVFFFCLRLFLNDQVVHVLWQTLVVVWIQAFHHSLDGSGRSTADAKETGD